jgi:hypothetical protein
VAIKLFFIYAVCTGSVLFRLLIWQSGRELSALYCMCLGVCITKPVVCMSYPYSSIINAKALFMYLRVCEFPNARLIPRDTEPSSIAGS